MNKTREFKHSTGTAEEADKKKNTVARGNSVLSSYLL